MIAGISSFPLLKPTWFHERRVDITPIECFWILTNAVSRTYFMTTFSASNSLRATHQQSITQLQQSRHQVLCVRHWVEGILFYRSRVSDCGFNFSSRLRPDMASNVCARYGCHRLNDGRMTACHVWHPLCLLMAISAPEAAESPSCNQLSEFDKKGFSYAFSNM